MLDKLVHAIDNVGRVARAVDWVTTLAPSLSGDTRPVSDSAGTGSTMALDLGTTSIVEYGCVVDAFPLVRSYRVQPDGGGPTLECSKGMSGPVAPVGIYDADTLTVGTHVRFMRLPNSNTGMILSTEPMYMWDPTKCMGDVVSQGSNVGLKIEDAFHEPFTMGGSQGTLSLNGGITDWSGRTPFDSLEIGDFNKSGELGTMVHADSYMTFLRADDYTGVWCFYWDGLCRIAGQQFQEWAGPSEREVYDDEGESMYYHGIATYPWEHVGMVGGPFDVSSEQDADTSQNTSPHYARIEPTEDDLQPFHRYRFYGGYLGQGYKEVVCAPILSMSGGGTYADEHLYSDNYYMPSGLYEQQVAMSGHWGVRTALGLTIAKRPIIPVPKRIAPVTSATGDNPDNYKASDEFGTGISHRVQPTPDMGAPTPGVTEAAWYRANTLMDMHAHFFNWEGMNAFEYHGNDYYVPEEDEYDHVNSNQQVPTWAQLDSASTWYLATPTSDDIMYDHRTGGTATVFRNTAYFSITDEGGVCIGDGWGSEIRMAGGCIFLQCPGDVFLAPGRNQITWAGRDICHRAYNAVDITANNNDVRLKAEDNLVMLAGNGGGPFGIFMETRGTASGTGNSGLSEYGWSVVGEEAEHTGIVMKAKNAEIINWCRNYYINTRMDSTALLQATGTSSVPSQPKEGDIVLDAKGVGDIITRSKFVKHWVNCAVMHAFPAQPTIRQVNFFTENGATLCNDVYVDGDLINDGAHIFAGDSISEQGHYFSGRGGVVGKAAPGGGGNAIATGRNYEATLRTWSNNRYQTDLQTMWYATGRPGNSNTVSWAWADLRIEVDYFSDSFTLWEARWQQMARLNSDTLVSWTENTVDSNDQTEPTYPFPGYQRLVQDTAYRTVNLFLYNTVTGEAIDRSSGDYEAVVQLNGPSTSIIDGNYTIIG